MFAQSPLTLWILLLTQISPISLVPLQQQSTDSSRNTTDILLSHYLNISLPPFYHTTCHIDIETSLSLGISIDQYRINYLLPLIITELKEYYTFFITKKV